jgi:hypothetical protein
MALDAALPGDDYEVAGAGPADPAGLRRGRREDRLPGVPAALGEGDERMVRGARTTTVVENIDHRMKPGPEVDGA